MMALLYKSRSSAQSMKKRGFPLLLAASLLLWVQSIVPTRCSCIPPAGCTVALGNYIISSGDTVTDIASKFQTSLTSIEQYNQIPDINSLTLNRNLSIPFPCECVDDHLGHIVIYSMVAGDTVDNVVHTKFENLSQTQWVISASGGVDPTSLKPGSILSIPINCSCGDPDVSTAYGMFLTYVIQAGDTLTSLSQKFGVQAELLSKYNVNVDMNNLLAYEDIIFVPAKDLNGVYPPYNGSATGGTNRSAIIGGSVGGAILFALVGGLLFFWIMVRTRRRDRDQVQTHKLDTAPLTGQPQSDVTSTSFSDSDERVIEFSYEQLAEITDNFNLSKEIGAGGFGKVYYAEINKKRLAIKKMDIGASKEFIAEVQVLARVHHTNLVQLVGWCKVNALFLVYEFVENGTLKSHLEAPQKGGTSLTWDSRLQIAIDSARGLEYIHEYTVPSYVHRDIKPDNILLDNSLHAKVADFGLAKLGEITGTTKNAGTFGYMAPESVMYGAISPKVDVFAFGVVLMQLVSAKGPIIVTDKGGRLSLTSLFEEFIKDSTAKEKLSSFVDPTLKGIVLQDDHTLGSVWTVIQLACECTDSDPEKRPNMKRVVTRLSSLLSPFQDRAFGVFNLQTGNGV